LGETSTVDDEHLATKADSDDPCMADEHGATKPHGSGGGCRPLPLVPFWSHF
jgi:hypothetical protein